MGTRDDEKTSISGLAKRWLKNQFQVHGDPQRAYRERQESDAIEQEIEDRVGQQTSDAVARGMYQAFAPAGLKQKVSELQRMSAEHKANETARQQAEHEAKTRATVQMRLSGDLNGALEAELPVSVTWPEEAGEAFTAEFVPLVSEEIAGRSFQMLLFAIPGYHGPGAYDLEQMARGHGADDWDPMWFQLVLDDNDSEPFYWVPDGGGLATVMVAEGEKELQLRIRMTNAGSENITIDAAITLP